MDQTCSPDCPVNRHHTYSAYRHGCRSPQARDDFRLYYKRRREGRAEPRRIDGTGTRRRIQALWAIGHASTTIGHAAGDMSGFNIQRLATRRYVSRGSLNAIRLAYQRLSLQTGTSIVTRKRAAAAGYAPPLAWDDDTIDDPNAQPQLGDPDADVIDEVAVRRALEGERITLTTAERDHAVAAGLSRGMSTAELARRLRISGTRALELAARSRQLAKAA
ncbi:hypothetical protein ACPB67_02520 [Micromonospora taraxaci]|uniref:hypothetical protein n=1 Tax=Micromonospora taraxaci TaxID=1316803 RepID=UPI003C2DDA31